MDEGPRLKTLYATRKYLYDDIGHGMQEDSVSFGGALVVSKSSNPHHCSLNSANERSTSGIPRSMENDPLASSLVYCLESKVKGTLVPLWFIGSFFQFVPARMGRNVALDDAVSCLCSIYCSPYSFHAGIYRGYVRALSSLRGCLSDVFLRMEAETLCASILLAMCEVSFFPRNCHPALVLLSLLTLLSSF